MTSDRYTLGKGTNDYPDFIKLFYYRWRFLIENQQYQEFYRMEQIDLICKEKRLLSEKLDNLMDEFRTKAFLVRYSDEETGMDEDLIFDDEDLEREFEEKCGDISKAMRKLNHIEKLIIQKARAQFKIRVRDIEYLEPIERHLEDFYSKISFCGYKIPFFGIDPKDFLKMRCPMYDDAVRVIESVREAEKVSSRAIFAIDTRYPLPFILEVFEEKMTRIIKANERRYPTRERKHLPKWEEYLAAYILSKENITHREIGRLMGAQIDGSSNKVFYTLQPIDENTWRNRYLRRNVNEMTQIKNNVRSKINKAKELIFEAGEGRFPGFRDVSC